MQSIETKGGQPPHQGPASAPPPPAPAPPVTSSPPKAPAAPSSKYRVVKGPDQRPHATIITGKPGVGKTYFVSTIDGVFWIPIEQGLMAASPAHVHDIGRFGDRNGEPIQPQTFEELVDMLVEFRQMARRRPGPRDFRHLAADGMLGMEKLVNKRACNSESVEHMEAKEFKKVWAAAIPFWQRLQHEFDAIRAAGAHVWIISHASETLENDIEGVQYGKWDLAFQGSGKSVADLRNLWRAWADHVLFLDWNVQVKRGKKMESRTVGKYMGRILRTVDSATHFAKNRASLPPTLPATWADLYAALRTRAPATEAKLRAQIDAIVERLGEEDRAAITGDLEKAKTLQHGTLAQALAAVLSRAQGMLAVAQEETAASESAAQEPSATTEPPLPVSTYNASNSPEQGAEG
jgi:hypothetical protein